MAYHKGRVMAYDSNNKMIILEPYKDIQERKEIIETMKKVCKNIKYIQIFPYTIINNISGEQLKKYLIATQ